MVHHQSADSPPASDWDNAEWDRQVTATGQIRFDPFTVVPQTPLIGADVLGLSLTDPLNETTLAALTAAFLRYKVLMIRCSGDWQMDAEQHTRLCQQLSEHWGLIPNSDQQQNNHSAGMPVHPFLPWQRDHPHIWPTGSVTSGGQQYQLRDDEDVGNFEPYAAMKARKRTRQDRATSGSAADKQKPHMRAYRPGSFGAAALAQDSVNNGANGFHFDDGFFHEPPSAVVLNSLVLPPVGGDTVFADMGAAYRGLAPELASYACGLTQTMDWRHTFPIWEAEAARGDPQDPFARHVATLIEDYPPSTQPLIRKHPVTGELAIYANLGFTRHINEVSEDESRQLMALLCRMAERPEYQVRMRWQNAGDVCIYDNRITQHYAVADYGDMGPRALHHIALLGEPTANAAGEVVG